MTNWTFDQAQANLLELIQAAKTAPQFITKDSKPEVVVIGLAAFEALKAPQSDLVQALRNSPLVGLELDFERDKSPDRTADLS